MSESPIYPIQKAYYRAKYNSILDRSFRELRQSLVEVFDIEAHAENTVKRLEHLKPFCAAFDTSIRDVHSHLTLLVITPSDSDIQYRTCSEVIQRLGYLGKQGICKAAEACETPEAANVLAQQLEDLEFVCEVHDDIVVIYW